MAAHQAPRSLGFSRQEYWSGLPFPSTMHESEKWKWSHSVVFDSSRPHGLQPTRLLRPWDFPGKSTGVGCHRFFYWSSNNSLTLTEKNNLAYNLPVQSNSCNNFEWFQHMYSIPQLLSIFNSLIPKLFQQPTHLTLIYRVLYDSGLFYL